MEKDEEQHRIRQLQFHFLGQIYVGSTFGSAKLSPGHSKQFLDWLKGERGLLLLSGPPGCGKTYLCGAAIEWMYGKDRDIYVHREAKFMSKVKSSFDMKGDSDDEVRNLIDHEFYIYDDLGSTGSGKQEGEDVTWKQKIWYIIVDERLASELPTIITTNYDRKTLKENVGPRTYSRLMAKENCIIEMFDYPDLRQREYMRLKPSEMGLEPAIIEKSSDHSQNKK